MTWWLTCDMLCSSTAVGPISLTFWSLVLLKRLTGIALERFGWVVVWYAKYYYVTSKWLLKTSSIAKNYVHGIQKDHQACTCMHSDTHIHTKTAQWLRYKLHTTASMTVKILHNSINVCVLYLCYRVSNFSEALARHYFTQILLAVMYLHERGVFHR